jgi:hypothetical protein
MRKLFSLIAAVLFAGSMMATTVTKTVAELAQEKSFTSGAVCTPFDLDDVISVSTEASDANTGKYYSNGEQIRLYQTGGAKIIFTAAEGHAINSITLTYDSQNTGILLEAESGVAVGFDDVQSATFTVGNSGGATNGQARITAISVTYDGSDTTVVPLTPAEQLQAFINDFMTIQGFVAEYVEMIDGAQDVLNKLDQLISAANLALSSGNDMIIENAVNTAKEKFQEIIDEVLGKGKGFANAQLDAILAELAENEQCQQIIADAKELVDQISWDDSKSVRENLLAIVAQSQDILDNVMALIDKVLNGPTNCAEAAIAAMSVSENNELYNNGAYYTIEGYVSSIAYEWKEANKNMSFWMDDTINGGNVLEAYKCVIEKEEDAVRVGDKVAVTGQLTKYNTTPEFAAGCTVVIIERAAPVVVDTYTIAGSPEAVFGSLWDPTDTNNDMVLGEDSLYYWEKKINLKAGTTVEFKVVKNHSWDVASYPESNVTATVEEDGEYRFPIAFQPKNQQVFASLEYIEPPVVPTTCAEAREAILALEDGAYLLDQAEITLQGYVTEIVTEYSEQYGNITFWMADAVDGGQVIEAYRAKCAADSIPAVGDFVEVVGKMQKYVKNDVATPEFAAGSKVMIIAKAAEEGDVWVVTGSNADLFGEAWNLAVAPVMELRDSMFVFEKAGVAIAKGNVELKVVFNRSWDNENYPENNFVLPIEEDGLYDVRINFDPFSKEITALAEKKGDIVIDHTVAIHGSFNDWSEGIDLTLSGDKSYAKGIIALAEGDYEFKVVLDGGQWRSNAGIFVRDSSEYSGIEGNDENNMLLKADVAGDYEFVWFFENDGLSIIFPEKGVVPGDAIVLKFNGTGEDGKDASSQYKQEVEAIFDAASASYVASIDSVSKVYAGRPIDGDNSSLKFGTTSAAGYLAFSLVNAMDLEAIVVNATQYGNNESKIAINGVDFTLNAGNKVPQECAVAPEGAVQEIVIEMTSSERFYLRSITLVPKGGVVPPVSDEHHYLKNNWNNREWEWKEMVQADEDTWLLEGVVIGDGGGVNFGEVMFEDSTLWIEYKNIPTWLPTGEEALLEAMDTVSFIFTPSEVNAYDPETGHGLFAMILRKHQDAPAGPTNCVEAAAAALSVSENNEPYNNGAVYTIEGYVTSIKTAWNEQYKNISFWMADEADGGEVLQAYRAVCENEADAPKVGDKVKVTGSLTKYNSTPEFAAGCTFEIIESPVHINYYVCGNMTDWKVNEAYILKANPANAGEYMGNFTFADGAEFKVVSSIDGSEIIDWFPDGMNNNYQISEQGGDYTVYFRPEGGVDSWYYGFFTVIEKIVPQYEVAEAIAAGLAENDEILVRGIITKMEIKGKNFAKYGSVNIFVADATGAEGEFEFYNCYSIDADTFRTSAPAYDATSTEVIQLREAADANGNAIHVGDTVIAFGKYQLYNTMHELKTGCYLVDIKSAPVEPIEPDTIVIDIESEVVYVDQVADEGWWQFMAENDEYEISLSNVSTTQAAGVYGIGDMDYDYTVLTIKATGAEVHFVAGELTLTEGEDGSRTIEGAMTGDDGNLYIIKLVYNIPVAENTVDVVIPEWGVYDGAEYFGFASYIFVGEAEDSTYVQITIMGENPLGQFTYDDCYSGGTGIMIDDEWVNIYSMDINVIVDDEQNVIVTADILCFNNTLYHVTTAGSLQNVESIEAAVKAIKRMVNGQLFIEKGGKTFNAAGQLVK